MACQSRRWSRLVISLAKLAAGESWPEEPTTYSATTWQWPRHEKAGGISAGWLHL